MIGCGFFLGVVVAICYIANGVFPDKLAKATVSSVGVSAGLCLVFEVYMGSSTVMSHVVFVSVCALIVAPLVGAAKHSRRKARHRRGHCPQCGFNLTGNVSGRCPECGRETNAVASAE